MKNAPMIGEDRNKMKDIFSFSSCAGSSFTAYDGRPLHASAAATLDKSIQFVTELRKRFCVGEDCGNGSCVNCEPVRLSPRKND